MYNKHKFYTFLYILSDIFFVPLLHYRKQHYQATTIIKTITNMRKIFLLLTLMFCISASAKKTIPVFITAGQSNTDGRIGNELLPSYILQNKYQHCYWCYNCGANSMEGKFELFWPRIINKNKPGRWTYDAVTYYWLEQSMKADFYVIKESLGGTAIDTSCKSTNKMYWCASPEYLDSVAASDKGGKSLLKALCENIDLAIDNSLSKMKGDYEFKAMLWHQGESDRHASGKYYENLKAVIAYIRQHLVEKTGNKKYAQLPILLGGISHKSREWSQGVEAGQKKLQSEDPNVYLIEVPDATLQQDIMHFDAAGGELLGKKMYNKLVDLKLAGKNAKHLAVQD